MLDHLDKLESRSIYVIREAYKQFQKVGMLWSIGKDSVTADSELYFKIDGKLKYGTIEDLFNSIKPDTIIKKGNKKFIIPKEEVEVLTMKGKFQREATIHFGKVTVLMSHPTDKNIYKVMLSTDRTIKTTGDHSLVGAYSDKKGLRIKPTEVRKLGPGDTIFSVSDFGFDVKDLKSANGVELEDNLLILAGLWTADGCYALNRKIIISTGNNKGMIDFLKGLGREKSATEEIAYELSANPEFDGTHLSMDMARNFANGHGVSTWTPFYSKRRMNDLLSKDRLQYVKVNGKGDAWICSKRYTQDFMALGFEGKGDEKKVPKWLYQASNRQIALFLSGYFAGDGSCWLEKGRPNASFSSMNKRLLDGMRPLLWRLGIDHSLSASSAKKSGFRTKHDKIYQISVRSFRSIENMFGKIHDIAGKFKGKEISWKGRSIYDVSAKTVRSIEKMSRKRRTVYDLEVEDTHNFITNGIVCHNSTTLLWLCKKAFFGKVPFPVIYIDTGCHFREMYEFRDWCVRKWGLDLIVSKNVDEAVKRGIDHKDKLRCCDLRKTRSLKKTIAEHGFDALLLGIRRDEHGIRAKERVFSPRNRDFMWDYKDQPPELWDQFKTKKETEQHLRVHPLLHWTEIDIWNYIKREKLPVNPLYFAKGGKRYRSLGCMPCTRPVVSRADTIDKIIKEIRESRIGERSGRAQDKETAYAMQQLRALGYM